MLKTYALPFALLISSLPAQSQLVTLEDLDGNVVNEQTITVLASEDDLQEFDLLATLTGSADKTVNVKRYELNVVPGSENYYCWGICYLPQASGAMPVWVSGHEVDMSPGVEFNGFHSYYVPNGTSDVAGFRFVWYDLANSNDSTWVDIYFDTEHVGIDELAVTRFEVFPNPAAGGDITVEHAIMGSTENTELVMYDALGARCFAQAINAQDTGVRIKAGTLPAGIYLAAIEDQGRLLATRMVVIASR